MKKGILILTASAVLGLWAWPALGERVYVTDQDGRIRTFSVYQSDPFTTRIFDLDNDTNVTIKRFPSYEKALRMRDAWDPRGGFYGNGGTDDLLLDWAE